MVLRYTPNKQDNSENLADFLIFLLEMGITHINACGTPFGMSHARVG